MVQLFGNLCRYCDFSENYVVACLMVWSNYQE